MVEMLKNMVEILKQRIRFNLDLIHENEEKIRSLLREPVSEDRSKKLENRFKVNKKMIQENSEAIKIQNSLINYLDKYHGELSEFPEIVEVNQEYFSTAEMEHNNEELSREDYFDLTINKSIVFDDRHPYYQDEEFINNLLSHFIDIEDYEMCANLKRLQEKDELAS